MPSTEKSSPVISNLSSFIFEKTPTAVWQSPSKIFKTLRSDSADRLDSSSFILPSKFIIFSSFSLHWMDTTPCPALGIISSVENSCEIKWSKFKDFIPALERIIASNSLLYNLEILVSPHY